MDPSGLLLKWIQNAWDAFGQAISDLIDYFRPGLGSTANTAMGWAGGAVTYQEVSEKAYDAVEPLWCPQPGNEGISDIYDEYNRMKTPTGQRLMGYSY